MGGSYPSAEVQSVYSTAPADWAKIKKRRRKNIALMYFVMIEYCINQYIMTNEIFKAPNDCIYMKSNSI